MKDELEVKVIRDGDPVKIQAGITNFNPQVFRSPTEAFAPSQRMILNPDKEVVAKIIERIYKCGGKCPCQPQDSENDTRCPCPTFTVRGKCCCKLFVPAE